jgi:hypothetical protein
VIRGTGNAGDVDGDGLGVGDADTVGEGEAVADGDATGDLDGDGLAGTDGEVPEGVPGDVPDVTVSAAGMMSAGNAPGSEDDLGDADREVTGNTGAEEAGPGIEEARIAAALGCDCAAWGCLPAPERAKLTAADAAMRPAATPATASGRHRRRREPWSRMGTGPADPGAFSALTRKAEEGEEAGATRTGLGMAYSANAPMAASGSQPVAGCTAPTSASSSSAVGRWRGSLARQRWTSGRSSAGT